MDAWFSRSKVEFWSIHP